MTAWIYIDTITYANIDSEPMIVAVPMTWM